jgi:hypothetical protein
VAEGCKALLGGVDRKTAKSLKQNEGRRSKGKVIFFLVLKNVSFFYDIYFMAVWRDLYFKFKKFESV